ncbi:MAG: nuclear transport factor 2 family protein [Planctomycetes bacterium]|nr:nuclear transport factor 2 family protein [Planctomycetota bacterium]
MTTPLEIVRGLYAAFAAGDIPAFLAALAPDIHWCEAENFPLADGNPYRGAEAIVQGVFARLGEHFDGFRVEPGEFVGGGDFVTMLGRYRAVGKHSGKPLDVQVAHLFWLQDGKVVRFQQMVDTKAVAAVLAAPEAVAARAPKAKAKGRPASKGKAKGKAAPRSANKARGKAPAKRPATAQRKPAPKRRR